MSDKNLEENIARKFAGFCKLNNGKGQISKFDSFKHGYLLAIEETEERLREAEEIIKKLAANCFEEPDTYFACTFCDMGDSGHSAKGKGYHDDYCLAKLAKAYWEKWK